MRGSYRGYDIVSMPPPSSGGVHLIEMLNILEGYDLARLSREESLHDMIEAMKRAYADRAVFMGDPDSVKIPVGRPDLEEIRGIAARQHRRPRSTPSAEIRPGKPAEFEGRNTTHFSVIDRDGNAVSNTYTLNFSYGLGLVAEGTGVLLNNELDDFTAKPGTANAYGLVGYNANLPGPGKRPLSSMTPTIVLKDGKPFLITGSPGGSRIISAVLQVIVNVIDFHMPIGQAVQRAARCISNGNRTRSTSSRDLRPRCSMPWPNAATRLCRRRRTPRPIPLRSLQTVTSAPPTGARAARWRRDTDALTWLKLAQERRLERAKGFEPSTPTLARSCSTPELHPHPLDIWPKSDIGRQARSYSQKRSLNATMARGLPAPA